MKTKTPSRFQLRPKADCRSYRNNRRDIGGGIMNFKETAGNMELLNEISDKLGALVIALECARVADGNLMEFFNVDAEENKSYILTRHKTADIENAIVFDYIINALDKAKELDKMVQQVCEKVAGGNA